MKKRESETFQIPTDYPEGLFYLFPSDRQRWRIMKAIIVSYHDEFGEYRSLGHNRKVEKRDIASFSLG